MENGTLLFIFVTLVGIAIWQLYKNDAFKGMKLPKVRGKTWGEVRWIEFIGVFALYGLAIWGVNIFLPSIAEAIGKTGFWGSFVIFGMTAIGVLASQSKDFFRKAMPWAFGVSTVFSCIALYDHHPIAQELRQEYAESNREKTLKEKRLAKISPLQAHKTLQTTGLSKERYDEAIEVLNKYDFHAVRQDSILMPGPNRINTDPQYWNMIYTEPHIKSYLEDATSRASLNYGMQVANTGKGQILHSYEEGLDEYSVYEWGY